MIDTCQANTMFSKLYSPNILATGSSVLGENSYSYQNDNELGVSLIDTYTHYILEYMEGINKTSHMKMADLVRILLNLPCGLMADLMVLVRHLRAQEDAITSRHSRGPFPKRDTQCSDYRFLWRSFTGGDGRGYRRHTSGCSGISSSGSANAFTTSDSQACYEKKL